MSQHTDETLVRDVTDVVNAILNDDALSKVVRDAGVTSPLSDEDEGALFDFIGTQPFMERFRAKKFEAEPEFDRANLKPLIDLHMARLCNTWLIIAVARLVAAGTYPHANDKDAQRQIARNAVPSEIWWDSAKEQFSWTPPKLTFLEYYQILRDAWSDPNLIYSARKAIEAWEEVGTDDRTKWAPARNALEDIPSKYLRRRGLSSSSMYFWEPIIGIVHNGIDINDEEQVRQFLSKFKSSHISWETEL